MTVIAEQLSSRGLVSDELFERLVDRIAAEEPTTREFAERIMEQALAFLYACAGNCSERLSPSATVDIGWHTFILYTHEYAEFCDRIAGRFIHHVPDDGPTGDEWPTVPNANAAALAATVAAMRRAGYHVDLPLWSTSRAADCTQCHAGCTDSPTR